GSYPESGRSVGVDLEELPATVHRPRPVKAREEAPGVGRPARSAKRGEPLRDAEDAQELGVAAEVLQHAAGGTAEDARCMLELIVGARREAYGGQREVGEAIRPGIGVPGERGTVRERAPRFADVMAPRPDCRIQERRIQDRRHLGTLGLEA